LAVGVAAGAVQVDVKLPERFWVFLSINLLFTCVAEEAFFRGVIQERVTSALGERRWAVPVSVALSAVLFGLAHAGGGVAVVAVSTIAGIGYAAAYARSRSIESAVLAHFLLNAIHFVGFTYPSLAR
jgi:membrane protease YdiL (CAAX protease family)